MKLLILFIAWCVLFVLCWPLALVALVLLPFVWLLSLPFRLFGIVLEALFAFVRVLLFLPARGCWDWGEEKLAPANATPAPP